jgi:hypothetical protein
MRFEIYIMRGKKFYDRIVVNATCLEDALYQGRAEKKRIYNNTRRLTGKGIKGLKIYTIVIGR